MGLSACSANWCISAAKSICPSSSSGWIIQIQHYFIIRLDRPDSALLHHQVIFSSYFVRLIIHLVGGFRHHTVVRDISIRFLLYRGQNFCKLLLFISKHPHYPSLGRRASQLEYQASYQQLSLSGGRPFAWANSIEDTYVLGY